MIQSLQKKFAGVVVIFLVTTLFTGCAQGYRNISHDEAQKIISTEKDFILLDVRTPQEYEKKHIPNAVLLPIDEIKKGNVAVLPDKNQKILIYCWTGRRAEDSAAMLVKMGYKNVLNFGGLVDWTGAVEGTETN